ncbi:MAG: DUF6443 domain-containing protein [Chitinophagaceae bacterium]
MRKRNCIVPIGLAGILFFISMQANAQAPWNPNHKIGTINGVYNFAYNQAPAQIVELFPATASGSTSGLSYQWEMSSFPLSGFAAVSGATQSSYTYPYALSSTLYLRRKTTNAYAQYIYSNVIKLTSVSTTWEDINYIRENDVNTTGITTWTAAEQLAIGPKLQTTTYLDGLGRGTQKVSRETATPANPNNLWGDMVQFSQYDVYGRQPQGYLPYTTTSQSGKYKTAPLTEQPQYYTTNYSESFAYSVITFDNSPLNRVMNVKQPGTSWNASAGRSAVYDMNTAADAIPKFLVDYIQGNPPVYNGLYDEKTLYKLSTTDENGKGVVEFIDKHGKLILRAVQLADNVTGIPVTSSGGEWICTYNVYDDFGLLRCQVQPEGVKYLTQNSWSFGGTNGTTILNEQCFQYNYDEKGRVIWKKAPGAQPLQMLYDVRDRVVFMQDGNQAALSTPQWTANIYDELDRPLVSTLYNTTKTVAQLQADINSAPVSSTITITNPGTVSVTVKTYLNPITSASLNNSSVTTILKYQFYDNYSFNAVKTFNTNYTNLNAYNPGTDPNVQAISKTLRTTSMSTGSMTRVLNSTTFLSATDYYDERGSLIQTLEDNMKTGTDITTIQYHFDGRVMSTCNDHTTTGTGYTNFKTLSKYLFDKLGRVNSIQKQYGSNAMKTISSYEYDDVGRLKTKNLDPGYTPPMGGGGGGLEQLSYSYNIHNQITGINKDYALKNPLNYNKWGHFFGLYLGFDNRDNVFNAANLTGQVTGLLWNTQGDDAQRKYDYTYDNAGRLTKADFKEKQHTGDAWNSATMDFSISGTTGKITYDLNGNLLNMLHKGVIPGTATPITVDNLSYTYGTYSNKLQSVTDNMTNTTVNGQFGDFKDGTNGASPDYVYDNNGNVVIDLNKNAKDLNNVVGANGIKYNFLDKPEQIRIAGKGTITIVYSAAGEKLQRTFTPEPSGSAITTTYINQFVYQETGGGAATLQFINFEEGRIRVITPTSQGNGFDALVVSGNVVLPSPPSGGGGAGVYDYFIMDYQQNVRMILTEEVHTASNTATMETARATLEESIFGQTGANNEVAVTRYATPAGWTGNTTAKVSRTGTTSGHNVGPNTLQKVMAGDNISATVLYYHQGSAGGNSSNMVTTVLGVLGQAITGSGATSNLVKNNVGNITTQLGVPGGFTTAVQPNGSNPSGNVPQAFLTVIFFDERFNFIPAADGGVAQQQVAATVGSNGSSLTLANIKAPKNGFAYIYVSNQSNNDVYFDNMQVGVTAGNIIEENHYYAYGLRIATLSSKKLGDSYEGLLKNNNLYNDKELFDDADLNWYDYGFRNYDPQIGRFPQLDPLTFEYPYYTPYQYAGCEPIANIDIDGLEPGYTLTQSLNKAIVETSNFGGAFIENVVLPAFKVNTTITKVGLTAGQVAGLAIKTANLLNNSHNIFIGQIKTIQCHGAYQNGYKPYKVSGNWVDGYNWDVYDGIVFYNNDGSGGSGMARIGRNPDPRAENISLILTIAQNRAPGISDLNLGESNSQLVRYLEGLKDVALNAESMYDGKKDYKELKGEPYDLSNVESNDPPVTTGKGGNPNMKPSENTLSTPKYESKPDTMPKLKIGTVFYSPIGFNRMKTSDSTASIAPPGSKATDTLKKGQHF